MKRDPAKYVEDVLRSIETLRAFVDGRSLEQYLSDEMLRSAVERQLITIGEALNQTRQHDPEAASKVTSVEKIIGFRNVLVHGYHVVDSAAVWSTIDHGLPRLHREMNALRQQYESR